jgi:hypothetical protein
MKSLVDNLIWRKYYHCFLGNILISNPGKMKTAFNTKLKHEKLAPDAPFQAKRVPKKSCQFRLVILFHVLVNSSGAAI